MTIALTDNFVRRLKELQKKEGNPGLMLRLAVAGGGCHGFEYKFSTADGAGPEDEIFEKDGAKLVVDTTSLPFLAGATVDFSDEIIGASFTVENPNAAASCGCGTSFSL